jgi:hypothetical protein
LDAGEGKVNLERNLFFLCTLSVLAVMSPVVSAASPITTSASFVGGSAEVQSIDSGTGVIQISPALREGRGWPCWWYFRIDGLTNGQRITVNVAANPRPFRPNTVLSSTWAQPDFAVYSTNDVIWQQTSRATRKDGVASYEFTAAAKSMWVAWGPPFLPSHADTLLDQVAQSVNGETFVLARTRDGRPVRGVRIGVPPATSNSAGIWIQARQHAWESGGSWVASGVIDWLACDEPAARKLREHATIYFVPIMDVDNVSMGAGGKEAIPRDHNRDWGAVPTYPEVAAAQKKIHELAAMGKLQLFIDLHNPSPSDRQPYFYGPFGYEQMTGVLRQNYTRFLELAVRNIRAPLPVEPKYRFATYVKEEEERGRMSGEWVRNRLGENGLALCLETAWNTPHNLPEGCRNVGGQLAATIAQYMQGVAAPASR